MRIKHNAKGDTKIIPSATPVKEAMKKDDDKKPSPVKLRGFGPDHKKGNMGNPAARAALMKGKKENK